MATASEVMKIAAGQIGYCRFDDPAAGTKYARWAAKVLGDQSLAANGVAYCDMFVSWVLDQAGQPFPGTPGSLITSQNATAPKLLTRMFAQVSCLITSQNATAPKPRNSRLRRDAGLITSQNATAPKLPGRPRLGTVGLITSQNATAPKQGGEYDGRHVCLITSQNATAPKLVSVS